LLDFAKNTWKEISDLSFKAIDVCSVFTATHYTIQATMVSPLFTASKRSTSSIRSTWVNKLNKRSSLMMVQ